MILLVQRAGTLVQWSEIQAMLWRPDVYVEHDSAINTAIRKIRRTLGDDAENPRFVETVVGKGYRFIARVEIHQNLQAQSSPNHARSSARWHHFWLGRIYTSEGRYKEAEAALQHIGPLRTWTPAMAVLGYLYGKTGRLNEARDILKEFKDLARSDHYASGSAVAVVHAGLGERAAMERD